MKKLREEIYISANPEVVWDAVTNPEKYTLWTVPFGGMSYFEGGWNTGDSIKFIGVGEDGKKEGMVSEIAESRRPEYISIRHIGYISDGAVDTSSEAVRNWAPAYENYTFKSTGSGTLFVLDMDVEEQYEEMFKEMWPKALQKLKELCEDSTN